MSIFAHSVLCFFIISSYVIAIIVGLLPLRMLQISSNVVASLPNHSPFNRMLTPGPDYIIFEDLPRDLLFYVSFCFQMVSLCVS